MIGQSTSIREKQPADKENIFRIFRLFLGRISFSFFLNVSTCQADSKYVPNYRFKCEGRLIAGPKVRKSHFLRFFDLLKLFVGQRQLSFSKSVYVAYRSFDSVQNKRKKFLDTPNMCLVIGFLEKIKKNIPRKIRGNILFLNPLKPITRHIFGFSSMSR
jgi:hypothetical protein